MAEAHAKPQHDYHLVDPSPWPLVGSIAAFIIANRRLDLLVDDDELERRRADWAPHEQAFNYGVLGKYAKLVGSAAIGAVCG